ncbi:MAG TPA: DUF4412 domain-containing protein [Candidatus Kapabacteria bacterium]|jgi:hypothetical protein|nr:DUF4412 domain-containing protein [Ignavibacteria bacterium]HRE58182.1 DUF4412 domain-containing protein [Candidatus Kapabacteria bacterium]HRK59805.1 DUF4412 domain-containing protein [Candidatus Kapabacteria bacterium]
MRTIIVHIVMVCVMSAIAFSAKPFQGKVTFTFKASDESGKIVLYAKGQKVKMEPYLLNMDEKIWLVLDNNTQKITVVLDDKAMYMTLSVDMMKKMGKYAMPGLAANDGKTFDTKPTSTGKTKTISGHECHQYILNDDGDMTEMWVAHDLGTFPQMMGLPIPQYIGKDDFTFFPLEIINKHKDGDTTTITVTELLTSTPDDSQFTPPASYNKMDIPGGH